MKKKKNNKLARSGRKFIARQSKGNEDSKEAFILKHKFKGSSHSIRSVNVSPNDRYLIITNDNNPFIRVVDLELLELLPGKFTGHTDTVRLTSITPDSNFFFTASWDGSVRKFELSTGHCLKQFSGFGRAPSVFYDPAENYLFAASYDNDIDISLNNTGRCWEVATGELLNLYPHKNTRMHPEAIDIVYDQEFVYTGSDDGVIVRYGLHAQKFDIEYFNRGDIVIRKLAVSENYLAAACTDGKVRVFYKHTGKPYKTFDHGEQVLDVRISKDESRIFSCDEDGSVKGINLSTFDLIFHNVIHQDWIWSMTLARDDSVIVTGSRDGSVAFISSDDGEMLARYYNLVENTMLIEGPADSVFPNGCFFTTDTDLVIVYDKNGKKHHNLEFTDERRIAYLDQLNLKNSIISKLSNNASYNIMTNNLLQQIEERNGLNGFNPPKLLGY